MFYESDRRAIAAINTVDSEMPRLGSTMQFVLDRDEPQKPHTWCTSTGSMSRRKIVWVAFLFCKYLVCDGFLVYLGHWFGHRVGLFVFFEDAYYDGGIIFRLKWTSF